MAASTSSQTKRTYTCNNRNPGTGKFDQAGFSASQPLKKLLIDISQIPYQDGKLYISPILDCYNGEMLSLIMRDNMKKELCIDVFHAVTKRYKLAGCILHSDWGSQYTSEAFREALSEVGVKQSLSGVNHCYDNSRMESFFATLK